MNEHVPPLIEELSAEVTALEQRIAVRKQAVNSLCEITGVPVRYSRIDLRELTVAGGAVPIHTPLSREVFPGRRLHDLADHEDADGNLPGGRKQKATSLPKGGPREKSAGKAGTFTDHVRQIVKGLGAKTFAGPDVRALLTLPEPKNGVSFALWQICKLDRAIEFTGERRGQEKLYRNKPVNPAVEKKLREIKRGLETVFTDTAISPKPAPPRPKGNAPALDLRPRPPLPPLLNDGRLVEIEGELVIDSLRRAIGLMPERFTKPDVVKVLPLGLTSGLKEKLIGENFAELRRLGEIKFSPWKRADELSEYMRGPDWKGVVAK